MRRKIIAGNWKMYGNLAMAQDLIAHIVMHRAAGMHVIICPPAALIPMLECDIQDRLGLGAQDCHMEDEGAFTGNLSAQLLASLGATHVIVGHSERRQYQHESNQDVCKKAQAALRHQLIPILCIGETEAEYDRGQTEATITTQLEESLPKKLPPERFILAYEPVWAIGTGKVPTPEEITAIHETIHHWLAKNRPQAGTIPVLYGGSVKPDNAREIMQLPGVDGVLVGGASLEAGSFTAIMEAGEEAAKA